MAIWRRFFFCLEHWRQRSGLRRRLARLVGKRCGFQAVFEKFGKVTLPSGRDKQYMLIYEVRDDKGRYITGHMWLPLYPEDLKHVRMRLRQGDVIRFDAEVNVYTKGTRRHRYFDYGLIHPRQVERINWEMEA